MKCTQNGNVEVVAGAKRLQLILLRYSQIHMFRKFLFMLYCVCGPG